MDYEPVSAATNTSKRSTAGQTFAGLLLGLSVTIANAASADAAEHHNDASVAEQLAVLEQGPDTPGSRALLNQLVDYQETALQPHPEGRGQTLPRYAIAARARHLLNRWNHDQALQRLRSQPALRSKANLSTIEHKALLSWLSEASSEELAAFRAKHNESSWPEDILARLVQRQNLWLDWLTLAEQAEQASSLRLVAAHAPLDHPEFASLLERLENNPAARGIAPPLRARWIRRDPQRLAAFQTKLQSATWDASLIQTALALAHPQLTDQLTHGLTSAEHAPLAAWALWQIGTAEARAALHDYAQSPTALTHLAQEIQAWLR